MSDILPVGLDLWDTSLLPTRKDMEKHNGAGREYPKMLKSRKFCVVKHILYLSICSTTIYLVDLMFQQLKL